MGSIARPRPAPSFLPGPIRIVGMYSQVYFGAVSLPAPDIQSCTDLTRPLAHARHSPMSWPPAVLKNLRIYATAVIANAQPQLGPGKRDFCFDLLCERMTKCVNQCLPADLIGVIGNNWIQGPRSALQNDLKRYRVLLCKFSIHYRERFGEVTILFFRFSQTLDSIPPFDDHLVGAIESAFDQLPSGLSDRYLGRPCLEAPHLGLNAIGL